MSIFQQNYKFFYSSHCFDKSFSHGSIINVNMIINVYFAKQNIENCCQGLQCFCGWVILFRMRNCINRRRNCSLISRCANNIIRKSVNCDRTTKSSFTRKWNSHEINSVVPKVMNATIIATVLI